jgi:hypothetical protein
MPILASCRRAAGGASECQLKPVAAADYNVAFSMDEATRLMAILPRRLRLVEAGRRPAAPHGNVIVPSERRRVGKPGQRFELRLARPSTRMANDAWWSCDP